MRVSAGLGRLRLARLGQSISVGLVQSFGQRTQTQRTSKSASHPCGKQAHAGIRLRERAFAFAIVRVSIRLRAFASVCEREHMRACASGRKRVHGRARACACAGACGASPQPTGGRRSPRGSLRPAQISLSGSRASSVHLSPVGF